MPIDWSTRPISSIATQRLVKSPSSPAPPYSSGAVSPNSPSLPIFCTTSTGKWWSRSHCAAYGAISASRELADALAELLVLTGQLVTVRGGAHGGQITGPPGLTIAPQPATTPLTSNLPSQRTVPRTTLMLKSAPPSASVEPRARAPASHLGVRGPSRSRRGRSTSPWPISRSSSVTVGLGVRVVAGDEDGGVARPAAAGRPSRCVVHRVQRSSPPARPDRRAGCVSASESSSLTNSRGGKPWRAVRAGWRRRAATCRARFSAPALSSTPSATSPPDRVDHQLRARGGLGEGREPDPGCSAAQAA